MKTISLLRTLLIAAASLVGITAQAQTGYYAAAAYNNAQAMQRQAYAARPVAYAYPQQMVRQAVAVAPAASNYLSFNGRFAAAPAHLPAPVQYAVAAGNQLQNKPYVRGGGHRNVIDSAYDCSGSVSYTLINAGLLSRPLSSKEFANFGEAGPGKFITIYVKPGEHVFMSICGLRLDTTGGSEGQGPRWRPTARSTNGFILRHPFGL
jgi:hypothetical protein